MPAKGTKSTKEERASIRYVHDILNGIFRKTDVAALFGRCSATVLAARRNTHGDDVKIDSKYIQPEYLRQAGESLPDYTSRMIDMLPKDQQNETRRYAEPRARAAESRMVPRMRVAFARRTAQVHYDDREQTLIPEDYATLDSSDVREKTLVPEEAITSTPSIKGYLKSSIPNSTEPMLIDPIPDKPAHSPKLQRYATDDLKEWLFNNDLADLEDVFLGLGIESIKQIQRLAKLSGTPMFHSQFLARGGTAFQWEVFCDALPKTVAPVTMVRSIVLGADGWWCAKNP
ncbi:hypothetical protein CALCODRAFT_521442 [Calocera cornea HHB12733]|uniref:Uncharacterized protein n=1 Tax=Calocera cornea HHB12733 TaxID=1353952 RepID=A0A165CS69_9BASI|nr:hypothetical protein CALCODRAFT_521442 [Calocera cornea HHB12733]